MCYPKSMAAPGRPLQFRTGRAPSTQGGIVHHEAHCFHSRYLLPGEVPPHRGPAHHLRHGGGDLCGPHGGAVHPHRRVSGFTFHDLTQEIQPISDHWQKEGIAFDAIYTGYLGSFEQIQLVSQFFDRFGGGDTLVYADPAMADNGVLYTGFTPEFALEMGKLCGKADVIVPNLTEAAFMLGGGVRGDDYDEAYVHALLKRLTGLGCKTAILTGISYQPGQIGAVAYDSVTDTYASYFNEKLPVRFHGTGGRVRLRLRGGADERQDLA